MSPSDDPIQSDHLDPKRRVLRILGPAMAVAGIVGALFGARWSEVRPPENAVIAAALRAYVRVHSTETDVRALEADASLRNIAFYWLDYARTRELEVGDWSICLKNLSEPRDADWVVVRETEQRGTQTFAAGASVTVRQHRVMVRPRTVWARARRLFGRET